LVTEEKTSGRIVLAVPDRWVVAAKCVIGRARAQSEGVVVCVGQWARVRADLGAVLQVGGASPKHRKEGDKKCDKR